MSKSKSYSSDARHPERKVGHVSLSSGEREYAPGRTFRERHSPDDVNSDKMVNTNDQLDTIDFGSEDFNAGYRKLEKHRHKKSYGSKREWDDDDSGKYERKEAKRNKKEEKRLPKENHDGHTNRDSNSSDMERTESEQKRLEIELRNKALESLRMKKAISHYFVITIIASLPFIFIIYLFIYLCVI